MTATMMVPGPIAIAIAAGRPELARVAIHLGEVTPELVEKLSDFAEAIVRDIQAERNAIADLFLRANDARSSLLGALKMVEQLQEACRELQRGGNAQDIHDLLHSQTSLEREARDRRAVEGA